MALRRCVVHDRRCRRAPQQEPAGSNENDQETITAGPDQVLRPEREDRLQHQRRPMRRQIQSQQLRQPGLAANRLTARLPQPMRPGPARARMPTATPPKTAQLLRPTTQTRRNRAARKRRGSRSSFPGNQPPATRDFQSPVAIANAILSKSAASAALFVFHAQICTILSGNRFDHVSGCPLPTHAYRVCVDAPIHRCLNSESLPTARLCYRCRGRRPAVRSCQARQHSGLRSCQARL